MIVGIDLGTTNSLIGHWSANAPRLVPNALGELLTPSAVGVLDNGEIVVGRIARERLLTHPELTITSFKRWMGTDREVRLGRRAFRAEELSSLVLRALIADAEAQLGEKIREAVISVPAYFSDAQRKATRNAGELAGIHVERLVNEPTAAALAYGLEQRADESKYLVVDLGGGTFDVSLLEKFEGVMEVRASAGDCFLGGEDFVDVLMQAALGDLGVDGTTLDAVESAQLRSRVERLKCELTRGAVATLTARLKGAEREWSIDEPRFESLCAPLLQRLRAPIERALRDSRIDPAQLDEVVLVGGASRMPMLNRLVARLFGRLPMRHIAPDETVARGTAVMAGMKGRHEAFDEIVMTDVCPYTLGVEVGTRTQHGAFSPIIERNTVIPVSRSALYQPMSDFQETLELKVYQGESPRTANNILLGCLSIELPKKKRADEVPVDVRFTYDVNGLLEVEATVLPTERAHRLVIERNPGLLSPDEIARRLAALAALKLHPREAQANLAVIARAERLYEEHLGDTRQQIAGWLDAFRCVLETQDAARIERSRTNFARALDSLEDPEPVS